MGYETGKRFICQDCEHISVVTIEFQDIAALVAFIQEKGLVDPNTLRE